MPALVQPAAVEKIADKPVAGFGLPENFLLLPLHPAGAEPEIRELVPDVYALVSNYLSMGAVAWASFTAA